MRETIYLSEKDLSEDWYHNGMKAWKGSLAFFYGIQKIGTNELFAVNEKFSGLHIRIVFTFYSTSTICFPCTLSW